MNTKRIVLSAIIAALPFTANATQTIVQTQTPAAVGANGTVNQAAVSGPYQTATIGEHDDEHIATTAYVKGAYNDAIAAVNKVDDDKQARLVNGDDLPVSNDVASGNTEIADLVIRYMTGNMENYETPRNFSRSLAAMDEITYSIVRSLQSQRATIYTTWDTNDTTDVAFKTVMLED